jgi:hypothetical protein
VFTDTTYSAATHSTDGLMSAADKTKLDGIETGAEKNNVFVAVYGTTTYAEIDAAYAAGKTIAMRYSNQHGPFPLYDKTASKYTFDIKTSNLSVYAHIDSSDAWTSTGHWIIAKKNTALSKTLASGSWSSSTPPTQTISVTGVIASDNIIVGIASTATSAQYEAAAAAKLLCTAQGTGTITVTCYGTEPTEDIPISVLIVG